MQPLANSISPWESLPNEPIILPQEPPEETKDPLPNIKTKLLSNRQSISKKGKSKEKVIKINTSRSRGELSLLKFLMEKNGWKEVFGGDGDVLWSGLAIPEESISIATEIRVNRIPGMPDLAHKKTTGYFLNKFREYFPDRYEFYPRTFLYPEEESSFNKYFKKNKGENCFIAKPTSGSQGDGIILINKLTDLPTNHFSAPPELVIQEYIDNPLIIDNKKFDLRLYVVIESVKPLRAFLCDEGLARFATEDYQKISKDNLRNYYMHLTNYSLNKMSPKFVYSEELTEMHLGSKRTLTSLWKSIEKEGIDKAAILDNIEELIVSFLKSMHPFLLFDYRAAFGGKDNGKCFHVLGFDILLDTDLKPWLLEINNNPSLNINHEDESDTNGKNKKKNNSIVSPIDKFVKARVVEDTIKLVMMKPEEKNELKIGDCFNSLKMIFNEEEEGMTEEDLFKDILEIYGKLSGYKFRGSITASKFNKLALITGMTTDKFPKSSYDLLFTKTLRDQFDIKNMDFMNFLRAFEELASKLVSSYNEDNKYDGVCELKERIKREISHL